MPIIGMYFTSSDMTKIIIFTYTVITDLTSSALKKQILPVL